MKTKQNNPEISTYRSQVLRLVRPLNPIWGAEIGVYNGGMSYWLLKEIPGLYLYLVDPWASYETNVDYIRTGDPVARMSAGEMEEVYRIAKQRTDFAAERRVILRKTSVEAAASVKDESLDFCFIDGCHTHESVLQDWSLWWDKVRPGGILLGHDYDNNNSRATLQVKPAVDEFARRVGQRLNVGEGYVAWIWKPERQ